MTVSTTINHEEYTGNGVTTVFPYRFRIFQDSNLVVVTSDPTGNLTTLTLGTDYSVSGVNMVSGGNVTLSTPLADGFTLTIDRELEAVQETDFRNQGKFYAETHEDALDYLTMLFQQAFTYAGLALRKPAFLAKYYDALTNRISNLGNPVNPQDAVTKSYADSATEGTRSYTDQKVADEAEARAAGDAALQAQISGIEPLPASAFSPISWHPQIIPSSVDIPANVNAWSFGPQMTIAAGQRVQVGEGSFWTIAEGLQYNETGADIDYGVLS